MPSPNMPDPDRIPDMSLGERTERPAPSQATDITANPPPATPKERPAPAKSEPAPANWQEGDGVLAPWEPNFLYPGTIKQILVDEAKGDQALIEYDDGGEGWVFVFSLCPFKFEQGQTVQVRWRNGQTYYAGEIDEINEEEVRIRYDDGSVEWTTTRTLRIPCIENGPAAVPTKFAPWQKSPAAQGTSSSIPWWAIGIGVAILSAVLRVGCRAVQN